MYSAKISMDQFAALHEAMTVTGRHAIGPIWATVGAHPQLGHIEILQGVGEHDVWLNSTKRFPAGLPVAASLRLVLVDDDGDDVDFIESGDTPTPDVAFIADDGPCPAVGLH
jgi:hypothetical protein